MSKKLIESLGLEPMPGGGYFRRTYLSNKQITINDETRAIGSAIYYYLDSNDFSAWHRLQCDEIWHFYSGSNLSLHLIDEQGKLQCICLGDIKNSEEIFAQYVVPAGTWLAAEVASDNAYSLVGTTCFPSYDEGGFELAKKEKLAAEFPKLKDIIYRLSRD